MTSTALHTDGLGVSAGAARLLDGVTLDVAAGRIVAVVGSNGAGKTTLLDAVCGLVPSTGTVTVSGRSCAYQGGRPHAGVGRVFQGSPLPETLTVAEVALLGAGSRADADAVLDRFGLRPHASSFVSELSTGMRRILDLAVAAVRCPALLLLDEPASGLAAAEVDRLAELIVAWRDSTQAAVLIVEHDAVLVQKVADEVIMLDGGRIVAQGLPSDVLAAPPARRRRLAPPDDPAFRAALQGVAAHAAPAAPPLRRTASTWRLLRLGLREFAAGMASVLVLGVLNRVMKVELGISLAVVAAVLASYNLAAPFALAIGHRSDTRPIRGRRRTPYILAGTVLSAAAVAAAPHVAGRLAGGLSPLVVVTAVALFVAMGVGMYGSGTVFFALLADITSESERGHAASIVYLELMGGILAGVALTGAVLDDGVGGLGSLFAIAAVLVVALTTVAVWGQERGAPPPAPAGPRVTFAQTLRGVAAIRQARLFFGFMIAATLFLFLQQAVLEPFGGDVLGLSVRATSAFNAVQTIGVLVGMVTAGRALADREGHKRMAGIGLVAASVAFAALAAAAAAGSAPASWMAILGVGLATGLINVAALALMMGMADAKRVALFMGAWTVAHAIADGFATAGGGVVFGLARLVAGSDAGAYTSVFAVEAIGLALCLPLLRRIDPARFAVEAADPAAPALDTPPAELAVVAAPAAVPADVIRLPD